MNELEGVFRALDAKYKLALAERIRLAVITAAVSTSSYSLTLPGETTAVNAVPSVSYPAPQVADLVRVALVADSPLIVDVLGRGPIRESTATAANVATGSATFVSSGFGTDVITLNLVAGQIVAIAVTAKMAHTAGPGHGAVLSYKVTGATTYGPNDDDGVEQDNVGSVTCSRTTLFTAAATGSHVVTLQYRAIGGLTANFLLRQLTIIE